MDGYVSLQLGRPDEGLLAGVADVLPVFELSYPLLCEGCLLPSSCLLIQPSEYPLPLSKINLTSGRCVSVGGRRPCSVPSGCRTCYNSPVRCSSTRFSTSLPPGAPTSGGGCTDTKIRENNMGISRGTDRVLELPVADGAGVVFVPHVGSEMGHEGREPLEFLLVFVFTQFASCARYEFFLKWTG